MARNCILKLDSYHAAKVLNELEHELAAYPRILRRIVPRALNRAITAMRDETGKELASEYAVTQRAIKATMYTKRATVTQPVAQLHARGNMVIPLKNWKARGTKKGVTVKIKKSERPKLVSHKKGKRIVSFIAGDHVYSRPELSSQSHIRRLYGPSFLSLLRKPEMQEAQMQRAIKVFEARVRAEATYELSKVMS